MNNAVLSLRPRHVCAQEQDKSEQQMEGGRQEQTPGTADHHLFSLTQRIESALWQILREQAWTYTSKRRDRTYEGNDQKPLEQPTLFPSTFAWPTARLRSPDYPSSPARKSFWPREAGWHSDKARPIAFAPSPC